MHVGANFECDFAMNVEKLSGVSRGLNPRPLLWRPVKPSKPPAYVLFISYKKLKDIFTAELDGLDA